MRDTTMNAPMPPESWTTPAREAIDDRMEQVREILIGDAIRHLEARVASLEARIVELDVNVGRQVDAIQARVESLAGAAEGDRRATFEALAQSVVELGEQIRRISRG